MSGKTLPFDVPALCALPLFRRCYQAVVAGLSVFILTLVVWREPFRGYLAEVHLSGPPAEGIDLTNAVNWIKQTDKRVAAVATAAGTISTKPQIRATFLASRPYMATDHLDGLAERFLFQYLPDRLQNYRHTELAELRNVAQAAREREDAARLSLESLRQRQLALVLRTAGEAVVKKADSVVGNVVEVAKATPSTATNFRGPEGEGLKAGANGGTYVPRNTAEGPRSPITQTAPDFAEGRAKILDKLHLMRLELAGLLANCTDQHPDVITLRSQIAAIERELGIGVESREVAMPVQVLKQVSGETTESAAAMRRAINSSPEDGKLLTHTPREKEASRGQATAGPVDAGSESPDQASLAKTQALANAQADESAEILRELAQASRERQAAERKLSERMQELTNQPVAAQWSAAPAHLVTRLGGTPRTHTLALAFLLANVAGIFMFRVAANDGCSAKIESAALLASTLELPVVGNLLNLRDAARQIRRRFLTRARLHLILYGSELVIGLAVVACLGSIACEPSLARQVLADPFGTLSEVLGRLGG